MVSIIKCPICNNDTEYTTEHIEHVLCEEHIYCDKCGYAYHMAFSGPVKGFCDYSVKDYFKHTYYRLRSKNKRKVVRLLKDIKTRKWIRVI